MQENKKHHAMISPPLSPSTSSPSPSSSSSSSSSSLLLTPTSETLLTSQTKTSAFTGVSRCLMKVICCSSNANPGICGCMIKNSGNITTETRRGSLVKSKPIFRRRSKKRVRFSTTIENIPEFDIERQSSLQSRLEILVAKRESCKETEDSKEKEMEEEQG
ncbi:hypothetical protein Ahia01_000621900 [Argonauta hians]